MCEYFMVPLAAGQTEVHDVVCMGVGDQRKRLTETHRVKHG